MARQKKPTASAKKTQRGAGKNQPKGAAAEGAPEGRVAQMLAVWKLTRDNDPKLLWVVFGPAVAIIAVLVVVGILIGQPILFSVVGVLGGLLTGTAIFGRRATGAVHARLEGQPGAAAAVLQMMRGDWRMTPAVGFTRNQELVHRVLGRPGVVLVGEGPSTAAIRQLITDQKRRIGRVAPDTPIHDVIVGDGEGRVSTRKLQNHIMRLPRKLKKSEVSQLESRMKALGGPNVPIPKGPVPTRIPRKQMR
jgi:xanthosine utilization system XapX-like protein